MIGKQFFRETYPRFCTPAPGQPTCRLALHGRRPVRGSTGSARLRRSNSSRTRRTWHRPRRYRTDARSVGWRLVVLESVKGSSLVLLVLIFLIVVVLWFNRQSSKIFTFTTNGLSKVFKTSFSKCHTFGKCFNIKFSSSQNPLTMRISTAPHQKNHMHPTVKGRWMG